MRHNTDCRGWRRWAGGSAATDVSAGADYLVTGDKKLLQVRSYQGVKIVSPREFLAILQSQPPQ